MAWLIVFGVLLVGTAVAIALSENTGGSTLIALFSMPLLGALFFGRVFAGFWWGVLGIPVGLAFYGILLGAGVFTKTFAATLTILSPVGAVLAVIFLGDIFPIARWLTAILGAVAGGMPCFILSMPERRRKVDEERRKNIEEQRLRDVAEAEEKRVKQMIALLDYQDALNHLDNLIVQEPGNKKLWNKLRSQVHEEMKPLEAKLGDLNKKVAEKGEKNTAKIQKAKDVFDGYWVKKTSPEQVLNNLKNSLDAGYGFGFLDSLEEAKEKYNYSVSVVNYFVARHDVATAKATKLNNEYTLIRERALIYFDELKKISSKLSAKDRELLDAAKKAGIKNTGANIDYNLPSSLSAGVAKRNAESWNSFAERSVASLGRIGDMAEVLGASANKKKRMGKDAELESNIFKGALAVEVGARVIDGAIGIIGGIIEANKAKKELKKESLGLLMEIDRVEASRLKTEAFCLRVAEMNKSLDKTIEAYDIIFKETRGFLYPEGDASKTHKARRTREENGEPYFTESEKQEILGLCQAAGALASLVDAEL